MNYLNTLCVLESLFLVDFALPFLYVNGDLLREIFHGPGHHKTVFE